ncbi:MULTISPECIES: hypothetical protein [unclassified Sphingomonas]|uniref:hypothetical protein n=1 Tax=unclassified Sphingomonas TaxID=196159 RepID=UPI000B31986B|nr:MULTISPECIES: hypothetical protein [unclassified Sphingomonas]
MVVVAEILIEAIGTVLECAIDLLPDGKSKTKNKGSDEPQPVPRNMIEQWPPTGPYEER